MKLELGYDRAGRSEGIAFVVYESRDDACEAIRQFDGANANGTTPARTSPRERALSYCLDVGSNVIYPTQVNPSI